MTESFSTMLIVGTRNSLGRVDEVIELVLHDRSRLEELYASLFHDDEWARMRAADALEKICRQHPAWLEPYIDKIQAELSDKTQPSIQWHLAQIYQQVELSPPQKKKAIAWLKKLIATTEVDWIVSANAMEALVYFAEHGDINKADIVTLVKTQQKHHSKSVVRKAQNYLDTLEQGTST